MILATLYNMPIQTLAREVPFMLLLSNALGLLAHAMAFGGPSAMLSSSGSFLRPAKVHTFQNNKLSKFSQHSISTDFLQDTVVCRLSFWKNIMPGGSKPEQPTVKPKTPENDGWQELADPSTGRPYFWNKKSGATTWERPSSLSQPPTKSNEKIDSSPLVLPNPKQFAFSKALRTPAVGVASAAGKSGGRLKENQDASMIQVIFEDSDHYVFS
jgi:hypothetical protein